MQPATLTAATAYSVLFTVAVPVSGFAQSNTVHRVEALATDAQSRVYVHRGAQQPAALPPNLTFPESYRGTIESMLRRSEAFRRQCLRLGNAPRVRVRIRTAFGSERGPWRARTNIVKGHGGAFDATVVIRSLFDLPELIAHELEHVIEQMDGVDLAARALLPDTGVRVSDGDSFETVRAMRIGALVGHETRNPR